MTVIATRTLELEITVRADSQAKVDEAFSALDQRLSLVLGKVPRKLLLHDGIAELRKWR